MSSATDSARARAIKDSANASLRKRGHRVRWRKTVLKPQYVGRYAKCQTEYCVASLGGNVGYFGYELTRCDTIRRRFQPPITDRWRPL